jgi:c(7)-type cytochrome triheme protein
MKKILLLLVLGVFLLSGAILSASGDVVVEEEYDEDTYGPEAPIVWEKPVRSVVFDHKIHTMGAELDCDSCHDDLFEMEAGVAEENEDFTMATLYEGGYCGSCHDGSTAFASNTRCTACHIGVRGQARLLSGPGEDVKAH